jgi:hypothetical protein
MRKWLREWFAWQFSLRRLLVATVFLGVVLGLNLQRVPHSDRMSLWGWPLPVTRRLDIFFSADETKEQRDQFQWIPWTHQTYHVLRLNSFGEAFGWASLNWDDPNRANRLFRFFVVGTVIDALFALTVLFLILFLQIPCRQAPTVVVKQ